MTAPRRGRKRGGRNRGYFFRTGRGWYATQDKRQVPLTDSRGVHLKDGGTDERILREAYARFLLDAGKPDKDTSGGVTVGEVCEAYLEYVKNNDSQNTLDARKFALFDLCSGLPAKCCGSGMSPEEVEQLRIHDGFGDKPVSDFTKLDVDNWLAAHPTWGSGGRAIKIQAIRRALNYAVERRLITSNPIKGYKTPQGRGRVTYLSPEQEEALVAVSKPDMQFVIRTCIRTGMRPGKEFTKVTARHVVDHGSRMEIIFQPHETKTRKKRRAILIADSDLAAAIRELCVRYPSGPIFRTRNGIAWQRHSLSERFRRMKRFAESRGTTFDPDCCMYSCRHTYAKRILQGYWSGRPTNIETLARLMGNTPEVCRKHYLQWSELDNEHLWGAA